MGPNDQNFLRQLLETFSAEAAEHIAALSSGLLELETAESAERRMAIVETVFREAHSLKGAARAVNLTRVESICQSLEAVFAEMKAANFAPGPDQLDALHQQVSIAGAEIEAASGVKAQDPPTSSAVTLPQTVKSPEVKKASTSPEADVATAEKGAPAETVRVSTAKLALLLEQAEELVPTKATAAHRTAQLREITTILIQWERQWRKVQPLVHHRRRSVESHGLAENGVPLRGLQGSDAAGMFQEFLSENERTIESIKSRILALTHAFEHDCRSLDRSVSGLLEDLKQVAMIPFSSVLGGFPKIVRDLCRTSGKDAEFVVKGAEIEADRRILDEIKGPLIHLIRNCVDHGIEGPEQRISVNKPRRAVIAVVISPKNGQGVEVTISDDGVGIDLTKVRAAAKELHIETAPAADLDQNAALSLVFHSGLSTSPSVTELSGRGLGLAIVREKVEKLGGKVSVESQLGDGTTFRLSLPLTLSTFQGLLVRLGEQFFIIPGLHIERVLRIREEQIRRVENRELVEIDRKAVSVSKLADLLGIRATDTPLVGQQLPAVLLAWADQRLLCLVDEVFNVQEFVVKSLCKPLLRVRNISGTTVLPTGRVALVLNVPDLIRSSGGIAGSPFRTPAKPRRTVLVVDDSITTRTLLKGILESGGYQVRTAVDGVDALSILDDDFFDLVVSDVDMPRMGGFDLTARIRGHHKHSAVPVVLVTALDSQSDRDRGADAGANAYIVKSSFDQSNLLETVQRLV